MANYMFAGIVGRATGPGGNLNVAEGSVQSATATQSLGFQSAQYFVPSTPWMPRDPTYLKRKLKKKGFTTWFEYDGRLGSFLKNPEELLAAFGPISVSFVEASSSGNTTNHGPDGRFARPLPAKFEVTPHFAPGRTGNPAGSRYILGSIIVSVFGKITPAMLPALSSGRPEDITDGHESGLTGLLPRDIANRLNGPDFRQYRYTIEPFLSWFLTRSIPYAVVRRISADFRTRTEGGAGFRR